MSNQATCGCPIQDKEPRLAPNSAGRHGIIPLGKTYRGCGLLLAGDQPKDPACPVDEREGERQPPPTLVVGGNGDIISDNFGGRVAR